MKTALLVLLVFLNIFLIVLHIDAEGISFDHKECASVFSTPVGYLEELIRQEKYRLAFQFVRNQANTENPDPFFLIKASEFYLKGIGTEINREKAEHWLNKYLQTMGKHSGR